MKEKDPIHCANMAPEKDNNMMRGWKTCSVITLCSKLVNAFILS